MKWWASCLAQLLPPTLSAVNASSQTPLGLALNTAAGTALGLGLAAFYILPAAYERRYVQIAMAIIPFYRIQDNFLFHHTTDALHDEVLHTASVIAVILITLTAATLLFLRRRKPVAPSSSRSPEISSVTRSPQREHTKPIPPYFLTSLTVLTIVITLLLTPLTAFIWNHAPELAFLQFPWRLVAILAAAAALAIALALTRATLKPIHTTALTLILAGALTYPAYRIFHQTCDPEDTVPARLTLFHSNEGTDPTDEYTPATADNDSLAHTNPPYWLSQDANAKAPENTQAGPTPTHFSVTTTQPGFLILNLRDYPSWDISSTDSNGMHLNHPNHIERDDGLIALPLGYAAAFTIDIAYTHTLDQTLGVVISLVALAFLALLIFTGHQKKLT